LKLQLSRETLRSLGRASLRQIVGATNTSDNVESGCISWCFVCPEISVGQNSVCC
jgi:hypothetical protein